MRRERSLGVRRSEREPGMNSSRSSSSRAVSLSFSCVWENHAGLALVTELGRPAIIEVRWAVPRDAARPDRNCWVWVGDGEEGT